MARILGCIVLEHDIRLVLLAAALCGLACLTTMSMLGRAASHHGRTRTAWLAGAATVFGCGVWTTHFLAMLAFRSTLIVGYAAGGTITSFAIVWVGAVAAFWLAVQEAGHRLRMLIAGMLLGAAVGLMHYVGVLAMRLHGTMSFDPSYIAFSLLGGMACTALALHLAGLQPTLAKRAIGSGWLCLGIVVLHFSGMTALSITPSPAVIPTTLLIGSTLLSTILVGVSLSIIALSLIGSLVDQDRSRRVAEEESNLLHLAHHDGLTGLPNRLYCHQCLAQMVQAARETASCIAVLCLDLDRFKQVNDLLGHAAGDQLLIQVARRLQDVVRPIDLVARISGDEFVIAVTAPVTTAAAAALARRVVQTLEEPFFIDEQQVSIGTSVGIALGPSDGNEGSDLLHNADVALYQAKKDGRGMYRFFDIAMNERLRSRQVMEQDLRKGLQDGQLELHYQPLLDVQSKRITGFEALVRWRHPERGLVSPNDFIPLAEETGLILQIGQWVLEAACREAVSWDQPLRVAVNVSPLQFSQADLADTIIDAVTQAGLDPHRLEIEITESVLMKHTEQAIKILEQLRAHGINISLDDFGTGYSSLSYLRRFPFNKIKLDRSFIQGLGEDEEAAVITRAIVALGRNLHLSVTAEGVETDEQLEFLKAENCHQIQGYLISRPVPADQVAALMAASTPMIRPAHEPKPACDLEPVALYTSSPAG